MSESGLITFLYLACGLFFFLLGLTILRIGRASAPTRAAAMMLFFAGIGPLLAAGSMLLESNLREGSVVYQSMLESFEYLWEFFFPSLMLFALSFPTENAWLRRYPVFGLFLFLPYLFHLFVMMYGDRMLDAVVALGSALPDDRDVSVGTREIDVGALDNILGTVVRLLERVHRRAFALVNMVYAGVALWLLWRGWRRIVNPRLDLQMRTVFAGLTAGVAVYIGTKLASMTEPPLTSAGVASGLISLSLVTSGGTIAFAVIRQQFLGLRNVMRAGALYTAVAGLFVLLYIVVVRPIGEYFGQYSTASREVFEAGFIIVAVIAFQPVLLRAEEVLERMVLKGRGDAARRFHRLGEAVAAVTTVEELESVLSGGLREVLDTSEARLVLAGEDGAPTPLMLLFEEIGEPVRRKELDRLRELVRAEGKGRRGWWGRGGSGQPVADKTRHALEALDRSPVDDVRDAEVYVPIIKGSACSGYIALGGKIYAVPYATEDLGYLANLSTHVSAALQNIRLLRENLERKLFEEELNIARRIQMQLLPGEPPPLAGFDLSARTVPSRYVGGDYYDFVLVEGRWLVLVVADVSGKGIPASILTATLQATVRSNADAQTDPERMMARLNQLLYRNTSAEEFATLFYAVVDLETGRIRYANAGHEFPLVSHSGTVRSLSESGIVLGCFEDFPYRTCETELPRDGTLLIYTDGVTDSESSRGEPWGSERLEALLGDAPQASASEVCTRVIDEVRAFGTQESQDDLTLVVLKRSA